MSTEVASLKASVIRIPSPESSGTPAVRRLIAVMLFVSILLGVIAAWHGGNLWINDDGVSYLDLADAWLARDWQTVANGYWSPGYPWLLAIGLSISRHPVFWEPVVVRAVNLLMYLGALFAFLFFWRELTDYTVRCTRPIRWENESPGGAWWFFGFVLFLYCAIGLIKVSSDCADMCVAAVVFAASAILIRIRNGELSPGTFVAFGATLGLGYLMKAVMLPLTLVFVASALLAAPNRKKAVTGLVLTLLTFGLISAPWVLLLSTAKHRLTFGDSGRLNYVWYANYGAITGPARTSYFFPWRGSPGGGAPVHPMRQLLSSPEVDEFKAPFRASYPPWNDPSYWYEGVKVRFDLRQQLQPLKRSMATYLSFVEDQAALVVAALFLIILAGVSGVTTALKQGTYLVLPALAAFGLFALILVADRYIGPFVLLFWAAVFSELYVVNRELKPRILSALFLAAALALSLPVIKSSSQDVMKTVQGFRAHELFSHEDADVADSLGKLGLRPGDRIGYIQSPGDALNKYWARLAKVTIIADMPSRDVEEFWNADPATKDKVVAAFKEAGARVIVAYNVPPAAQNGWQRVQRSDYYVLPCPK
ncbi:MAG TPA: hypothetical protein VEI26_06575 [Terriglobales bacterium]|nr:hypothetical protein [Terriglobales bacterium]